MNKDYLIQQWLKGTLTKEEEVAFNRLDDAKFNQYIVDSAAYFKGANFNKVVDFKTFRAAFKQQKPTARKLNKSYLLLKIAAVIVVAFCLYFAFFFNTNIYIETLASEKTIFKLPDHSKVELNALSSVEFNASNWNQDRILELDGEAYFEVAKGRIFSVKTNSGIVTVVGTQFNVKHRAAFFEVQCFEGIVNVTSDTITRTLKAGNTFRVLNGAFTEGKTQATVPKWTKNISEFERVPFKEVLSEIERQFDIQISYSNLEINRLFTGSFSHDNLEHAIIAITEPMGLSYKMSSSNLVVIHGKTD